MRYDHNGTQHNLAKKDGTNYFCSGAKMRIEEYLEQVVFSGAHHVNLFFFSFFFWRQSTDIFGKGKK
jgi:hypothetical protein